MTNIEREVSNKLGKYFNLLQTLEPECYLAGSKYLDKKKKLKFSEYMSQPPKDKSRFFNEVHCSKIISAIF